MAKVQLRKTIRAPIEKVVEYFGNPELYFSVHSSDDASFKIVSNRENEIVVEEERDAGRRRLKTTHKTVLHLPHRIDSEIVSGPGQGPKQTQTFGAVSEGAKW